MTDQPRKRITIGAPDGSTILAARHLDANEGRVQVGATVDMAARSAITRVLGYIATAHNSPAAPDLEEQLDAAYRERAHLVAWLAALHPAVIAPAPDIDEPGWQILYLTSSAYGWQMTWHIHPRDAELFKDVEHVPADDPRAEWDGHSTEQKYNRMRTHVRVVHMNNRLGATSCPVCEGTGRCPSCHTTMRARPDEPVTAGRIVRQFPDERREQAEADVLTAEAVRQMDAGPTQSHTGLVIQPYRDHGVEKWVFRCWGSDTCDGVVSLDHTSQRWAEAARDRHLTEDHCECGGTIPHPDCPVHTRTTEPTTEQH